MKFPTKGCRHDNNLSSPKTPLNKTKAKRLRKATPVEKKSVAKSREATETIAD